MTTFTGGSIAGTGTMTGWTLYQTSVSVMSGTFGTTLPGGMWVKNPVAPSPAPTPTTVNAVPNIAPVLDNNVSVSVYGKTIPISAGQRRLPGDLEWLRGDQLNSEGDYTANGAWNFGYRLMEDATASLTKLWANGVVIYDVTTGFTADGLTFTQYDGSQTTVDPDIAADKGSSITPAFKDQLYIRATINTRDFNGSLPNISALWSDEAGGTLFRAWGGTLDPDNKDADIVLSDGDLHAKNTGIGSPGIVLGTIGRSSGRWAIGFEPTTLAIRVGLASESVVLTELLGTVGAGLSFGWKSEDGNALLNGIGIGITWWPSFSLSPAVLLVDLDAQMVWATVDCVNFYGEDGGPWTSADVIAGLHGLSISGLTYPVYPAIGLDNGVGGAAEDEADIHLTQDALLCSPPGVAGALTLVDVILAVARRCGLTDSDFTFVGLDDILVTGIVITQDTDFRTFLLNAGRAYGFDYTESAGRILCKKSVVASSYTVDFEDIPVEHFLPLNDEAAVQTTRAESQQLPTVIEITYQDETIDYQPSLQRARKAEARGANLVDSFAVPFVMNATEALTAAATALHREWEQRVQHSFKLPFRYLNGEPTDLASFTAHGKVWTVKLTNNTINSDLSVGFTAINLLTSEADQRTIDGEFQGAEYAGEGYSGDPNIGNFPMETTQGRVRMLWPYMTLTEG